MKDLRSEILKLMNTKMPVVESEVFDIIENTARFNQIVGGSPNDRDRRIMVALARKSVILTKFFIELCRICDIEIPKEMTISGKNELN